MVQNPKSISNIYNNIVFFEEHLYLNYELAEIKKYLQELYSINIETYNNRYKEKEKYKINWKYKELPNKYQLIQSLYFLDYQIEKEFVNMNSDKEEALKFLNELIFRVQKMIIRDLPEYNNTEWK
jgi:hypothetical protein